MPALQLTALTYGTYAIYSERPAYVVFAVDRYVALATKDVDFERVGNGWVLVRPCLVNRYTPLHRCPWDRPIRAFWRVSCFGGQPDLEQRPEFWLPLEIGKTAILGKARSLADLMEQRPAAAEQLARMAERVDMDPETALFVPMPGKKDDYAAIIDPVTARVIDAVAIDPWID